MSNLSTLAASMSVGSFAQLTSANLSVLQQGSAEQNRLPYANGTEWDPINKIIPLIVSDHVDPTGPIYAYYKESTDAVVNVEQSSVWGSHAFDLTSVNPYTGQAYRHTYGTSRVVYKNTTPLSAGGWVALAPYSGLANITMGTTWWSGSITGAGSQGCLMVWTSYFGGVLNLYDPLSDTWFYQASVPPFSGGTGGGQYHEVAAYSAVLNCAVAGGGNEYPTKLFRLDSDRSITILTTSPIAVGVHSSADNKANLCVDPVTGKFLLLGNGVMYELDPTGTGTYTLLSAPPSSVGDQSTSHGAVLSCAIPDYGVVVYFVGHGGTNVQMWLYKHAASTPPPPPLTSLGMFLR